MLTKTQTTQTNLWRAPGGWRGERVFIICGGPSVSALDLSRLSKWRVIAINSSCFTYPTADYLIFSDKRWWDEHKFNIIRNFKGQPVTVTPTKRGDYYKLMGRVRVAGLSYDDRFLSVWHTSTVAAINFACHMLEWEGEIALLGLDGKTDENGKEWHHAPHKWRANPQKYYYHGEALKGVAHQLRTEQPGIGIYNCNPDAAHKMFPFRSYQEMTA